MDRVREDVERHVLEQPALGARADHVEEYVVIVEGRQHDRGRDAVTAGRACGEPPHDAETIQPRHPDVDEDDVDRHAPEHVERFDAIARFGRDDELGYELEQRSDALPDERLIVDNRNPDGHGRRRGMLASTSNPPSRVLRASTWPPSAAKRSRMPVRPCPPGDGIDGWLLAVIACTQTDRRAVASDRDPQVSCVCMTRGVRHHLLHATDDRVGLIAGEHVELGGEIEVARQPCPVRRRGYAAPAEWARIAQVAYRIANVREQQAPDRVGPLDVLLRTAVGEVRSHLELHAECGEVVSERVVQVARDPQALDGAAVLGGGAACTPLVRRQRGRGERERLEAGERRAVRERRTEVERVEPQRDRRRLNCDPSHATPPDTTPGSWLATTTKIAAVTTSRPNHTMAIAASDCATRNASVATRRLVGVRHVTTNAARNATRADREPERAGPRELATRERHRGRQHGNEPCAEPGDPHPGFRLHARKHTDFATAHLRQKSWSIA